jgi:hypothetical protein
VQAGTKKKLIKETYFAYKKGVNRCCMTVIVVLMIRKARYDPLGRLLSNVFVEGFSRGEASRCAILTLRLY